MNCAFRANFHSGHFNLVGSDDSAQIALLEKNSDLYVMCFYHEKAELSLGGD